MFYSHLALVEMTRQDAGQLRIRPVGPISTLNNFPHSKIISAHSIFQSSVSQQNKQKEGLGHLKLFPLFACHLIKLSHNEIFP